VLHKIRIPAAWLNDGATLELDLPRNLACAACSGGGCDACKRSGAVTLRGRREPVEIVRVTLPKRGDSAELSASERGIVLRIPERGGTADIEGMPRGVLMLTVIATDRADPGVIRVEPMVVQPAEAERAVLPTPAAAPARRNRLVLVVAVLVVLWILALLALRLGGYA
jgi:hypothetical protein